MQTGKVHWYGGEKKAVEYLTFICLWYQAGKAPIPLRIVLVKTPNGKNEAETLPELRCAQRDCYCRMVVRALLCVGVFEYIYGRAFLVVVKNVLHPR